jgi:DNA-binding phage protein
MLEREWNVCALSENAGVSPAQTYRVFGGEAVPSLRWIVRIANALETPVGSLMSD